MKLFGKSDTATKTIEENIADSILQQEDRLTTLFNILEKLPSDLVQWFKGLLKFRSQTKGYIEVDIAQTVNLEINALPGDVIIRKNRDPKQNDIIEIGMKYETGYNFQTVKLLKINIKEGTVYVQNILEPDKKGYVGVNNIVCVIDKVIKYEEADWKKIVQLLDIEYDLEEIEKWATNSLKYIMEHEFFDKENTAKKLKERLKILKKG